jgi:hypothetical protein
MDVVETDAMAPGAELASALLSADPTALDHRQTLAWLRAAERLQSHLEARRHQVMAHFADLHPAPEETAERRPEMHEEHAVQPGGAGTPPVAEFAVNDVAVGVGCSRGRAEGLLGDALALRHRMPRLLARLRAGEVSGYKVRMILRAAAGASLLAARRLDEQVAPLADKIGPKRLEQQVTAILLQVDPGEAERRARATGEQRCVSVVADADGDRRVFAHVDAFDGLSFDAAVDKVADVLGDLGDGRRKDVRRAAAVGWLANPVAVLALLRRHEAWRSGADPMPWPTSSSGTVVDADGTEHLKPGLWPLDVPSPEDLIDSTLWPATTLVVHLDHDTWRGWDSLWGGEGVADLDGHGPVTAAQAFERLRHSQVTIQPVLDLDDELTWVSDRDTFTGPLRQAVRMAHRWNPFPYADAPTLETDDIDHTRPRGRAGPTTLGNGAPLRRRLHRHKTLARGWRVEQPFTGIVLWRSPEGRIYLHDRRGHTHDLGYAT